MDIKETNVLEFISKECADKINIGKVSHQKLMKVQQSIFKDIFMNTKNILSNHINLMASYNVLSDDYKDEEIDTTLELMDEINTCIDLQEYDLEGVKNITQEYLDLVISANNLMYQHLTYIKKSQRVMADIGLSELEDFLPPEVYNGSINLKSTDEVHRFLQHVMHKTFDSIDSFAKEL